MKLRLKFGLLLAGFLLALGTILFLAFVTAQNVADDLAEVKLREFPQFSEAATLAARFDDISALVEYAATTGERSLLEKADKEQANFRQHLNTLQALTRPGEDAQARARQIGTDFDSY